MKIKYKNDNVVVTFYEYIPSYPYQKDMVEMWSKSWAKQGWETIILGKEQAKTYPKYEKIIGAHWLTNWNGFLAACYKRYMAAWSYGDCLFCDPDVINYGWKYTNLKNIPRNKLAILGNGVPCLLYGTKEQYNNILEFYKTAARKPHSL